MSLLPSASGMCHCPTNRGFYSISVLFYVGFHFVLLRQGLTKALAGLELFHQFPSAVITDMSF